MGSVHMAEEHDVTNFQQILATTHQVFYRRYGRENDGDTYANAKGRADMEG